MRGDAEASSMEACSRPRRAVSERARIDERLDYKNETVIEG